MSNQLLDDYIRLQCSREQKHTLKLFAVSNRTDMSSILRTALVKYLKEELQAPEVAAVFETQSEAPQA